MKTLRVLTIIGLTIALNMNTFDQKSFASGNPGGKTHEFSQLRYAYNALEPYIDAQTMELHYSKHHRGYYDNFMKAATDAGLLETPIEKIMADISKYPVVIRNNGGGYYNHDLFWENMTPGKQEVPAKLKAAVEKEFGSWDTFTTAFETAANTRFGSGWARLSVASDGRLFVSSTPNQDNPLMDVAETRGTPILALDVWEHAYYLKYQNKRADYVEAFWNIVNWDEVNRLYKEAVK